MHGALEGSCTRRHEIFEKCTTRTYMLLCRVTHAIDSTLRPYETILQDNYVHTLTRLTVGAERRAVHDTRESRRDTRYERQQTRRFVYILYWYLPCANRRFLVYCTVHTRSPNLNMNMTHSDTGVWTDSSTKHTMSTTTRYEVRCCTIAGQRSATQQKALDAVLLLLLPFPEADGPCYLVP